MWSVWNHGELLAPPNVHKSFLTVHPKINILPASQNKSYHHNRSVNPLDAILINSIKVMEKNHEERITSLERRVDSIEVQVKPTKFQRLEIVNIFPIHDADFPEDLLIRILGYLARKDYLTCKVSHIKIFQMYFISYYLQTSGLLAVLVRIALSLTLSNFLLFFSFHYFPKPSNTALKNPWKIKKAGVQTLGFAPP